MLFWKPHFSCFLGSKNHPGSKKGVKKGSFLAIFRDFWNFGSKTIAGERRGSKKCFYETFLGQKWPFLDPFWTCFWRVWTLFGSFFCHFLTFLRIPEGFRPEFFKTEKSIQKSTPWKCHFGPFLDPFFHESDTLGPEIHTTSSRKYESTEIRSKNPKMPFLIIFGPLFWGPMSLFSTSRNKCLNLTFLPCSY